MVKDIVAESELLAGASIGIFMTTFETTQTAGPDGLVHLSIPVPNANQPYHLVVAIEPASRKK
jgi:hypothetical protein